MSTVSEIIDPHLVNLSVYYATEYKRNGKNFITCFLKYQSVRTACECIVSAYKKMGVESDQDFSGYVSGLNLPDRWRRVLNEVLKIIYEIVKK